MHALANRMHAPNWTGAIRAFWVCAAFAFILVLPQAFAGPANEKPGTIISAEIDQPNGEWRPVDLHNLKLQKGRISTLRLHFAIDPIPSSPSRPMGLYLSGVFSAQARWNGTNVGNKGWPGQSRNDEVAGPIDIVLPLESSLIRQGNNILQLRISSENLNWPVRTVIHGREGSFGIRVAPYTAEPRRPFGQYAAAFLMSGIFLVSLAIWAMRSEIAWAEGMILAGLLLCAIAEVSRSFLDYPYPWQDARLLILRLGTLAAVTGIVLRAVDLSSASVLARHRPPLVAGLLLLGIWIPFQDESLFALGSGLGLIFVAFGAVRTSQPDRWKLAAALAIMTIFAMLDRPDFMDQGLYAAAVPLIACIAWRATSKTGSKPVANRLTVGTSARRHFIPLDAIQMIQAAGDYAEIVLASGRRFLEARSLSSLAAELPDEFLRVHRSYIVNLSFRQELQSSGGGRYKLRVGDECWVPVARSRIAALRLKVGGMARNEEGPETNASGPHD